MSHASIRFAVSWPGPEAAAAVGGTEGAHPFSDLVASGPGKIGASGGSDPSSNSCPCG